VSCISSRTVGVSIYLNPTISATATRTFICKGESTKLTGVGAATYSWSNQQQGTTVTVSPLAQTTYTVIGADINGCAGTAGIVIRVSPCTGIDQAGINNTEFEVYPNPNNGEFTIRAEKEMTLILTNELGQLIQNLELKNLNGNKITVNQLPNGIYFISEENNRAGIHTKIIVGR